MGLKSLLNYKTYLLLSVVALSGCVGKVAGTVLSTAEGLSIEPSNLQMSVAKDQQFTTPGFTGPVTFNMHIGSGTVNSQGLYTSPEISGVNVVRASAQDGRSVYATIDVVERPRLIVKPTAVRGETLPVVVSGGKPPYTFSIEPINGASPGQINLEYGKFTAPSQSGINRIKVVDSLGGEAVSEIAIVTEFGFAMSSLDLNPGATSSELIPTGGADNKITYSLIGSGSFDNATKKFTSSLNNSTSILKAIDADGNSAYLIINTVGGSTLNNLVVHALPNTVSSGGKAYLSVEGSAFQTFTYTILSGGGSVNSEGIFTGPTQGGSTTILVSDASGKTGQVTVTSTPVIDVQLAGGSPQNGSGESLVLTPGSELTLTLNGGDGQYTVSSTLGGFTDATHDQSSSNLTGSGPFIYQTPTNPGIDSIMIQDSAGNEKTYYVIIKEELKLSPNQITVKKLESFQLSAYGGQAPYIYSIESGHGEISGSGIFTASQVAGEVIVLVQDQQGKQSRSVIQVSEDLSVNPFLVTTSLNKKTTFTLSGGTAPFVIQVKSGSILLCEADASCTRTTLNLQSSDFKILTNGEGNASLEISDSLGQIVNANVLINGNLSISSELLSLRVGQKTRVNLSGGVAPYSLNVDNSAKLSLLQTSAQVWEIQGLGAGLVSLQATSADGDSATLAIEVKAPAPVAQLTSLPGNPSGTTTLAVNVGGENVSHYQYKLGTTVDCSVASGYSADRSISQKISDDLTSLADGFVKLCVIGKSSAGEYQALVNATTYQWAKSTTPPTVALSGAPTGFSKDSLVTVIVSGSDVIAYRYQLVSGTSANCTANSYSNEILLPTQLNLSVIGDGAKTLCVIGRNQYNNWQTTPTAASWTADFSAPSLATQIQDGQYSSSLTATPQISFTAGVDDGSGLLRHQARLVLATDKSVVLKDWTDVTSPFTFSSLSPNLVDGSSYLIQIRSEDNLNIVSSVVESDGWIVDISVPTAPTSLALSSSTSTLTAAPTISWTAATDAGSGVAGYQAQLWKDEATDILITDWAAIASGARISNLNLVNAGQYYYRLRAVDNIGLYSSSVDSAVFTAQNGTVQPVISITPAVSGKSTWNLDTDGALALSAFGEYSITPQSDMELDLDLWGGAGGGGMTSATVCPDGTQGGIGGYASGVVILTSGASYKIWVGEGGGHVDTSAGAFGGGGNVTTAAASRYAGEGGGLSGIFATSVSQTNAIMIAAGGGGGASGKGGASEQDGLETGSNGTAGFKATGTAGGAGGAKGASYGVGGAAGGALFGGGYSGGSYSGGGGGSGYWGGGSGGTNNYMGEAGGGGFSFANVSLVRNFVKINGNYNEKNANDISVIRGNAGLPAPGYSSGGSTVLCSGNHGKAVLRSPTDPTRSKAIISNFAILTTGAGSPSNPIFEYTINSTVSIASQEITIRRGSNGQIVGNPVAHVSGTATNIFLEGGFSYYADLKVVTSEGEITIYSSLNDNLTWVSDEDCPISSSIQLALDCPNVLPNTSPLVAIGANVAFTSGRQTQVLSGDFTMSFLVESVDVITSSGYFGVAILNSAGTTWQTANLVEIAMYSSWLSGNPFFRKQHGGYAYLNKHVPGPYTFRVTRTGGTITASVTNGTDTYNSTAYANAADIRIGISYNYAAASPTPTANTMSITPKP